MTRAAASDASAALAAAALLAALRLDPDGLRKERRQVTRAGGRALRLVLLLTLLVQACPVAAQLDRPVRVGVYENPPKVYRDSAQRPAGLFIELIEAIAAENGWTLEYRDCPWNECLQALQDGELDLMPDVAATEDRRRRFAFHQLPVTQAWSQLYRPPQLSLLTLDDLSGLRVSVLQESVQQDWFQSRPELEVELVLVSSMLDGLRAVAQGRADAAATNNFFGSRFASAHGLTEAAITFDQQSLHFAAPLSADPQILAAIDTSLQRWKSEPDSPYFAALQRALVPEVLQRLPAWVLPLTLSLLVLIGLLTAFALLLRWRVHVRTEALTASRAQLAQVLASSPVALYRAAGPDLRPNWISPSVQRLFGFEVDDLLAGTDWSLRIVEEDRRSRALAVEQIHQSGQLAVEYRIRDAQGNIRQVREEMRYLDAPSESLEVIGTWTDLTTEFEQREHIRFLRDHDRLTQLPNRAFFVQQCQAALEHGEVSGSGGMIVIIDLDRFGMVNEAVGLAVGDQLLLIQARRLLTQVAATDLVARSGNDEFCILLAASNSEQPRQLCEDLLAAIAAPVQLEGRTLTVTASIGVARFPEHGHNASEVLAAAELALHRARKSGGNSWEVYRLEFGAVTSERLFLEQGINQALERDQFLLYFQPQYALADRRLVGFECLVRWQHPQRGLLSPAQFIPLAEETGQIRKIDLWVLHRACRHIVEWQRAGLEVPRLSINLSASEFRSAQLVDAVAEALQTYGIEARQLELEITETTLMQAPDQAAAVMRQLHQLGVRLSMDDFGTGYSNLAQLLALPLSQVKIDRSLLANIERSDQKRSVLRAIIALGKALRMELIAEGIETEAQLEFLRGEACPLGQGFLLGHPVPAERAIQIMPVRTEA
ncbi:MAG: EAL domain-containing protein [Wenzhouxiangella sp.]